LLHAPLFCRVDLQEEEALKVNGITVLLLWLAAMILLAPAIDTYDQGFMLLYKRSDVPVLWQVMGEARSIISNLSLLQADLYFHGGIGDACDEHEGSFTFIERGVDHDHERYLHGEVTHDVSPYNVLLRLFDEISVTEHIHLEGDQLKEIVPWLYMASEADPNNVLAYTLTGYYLAYRLDRVEQAIAYLKKGLMNNPDSWEINGEIGRIYFQKVKDYGASSRYLSRAKVLLEKAPHDKFQERAILAYLALSYERLGEEQKALPLYHRLDNLFPDQELYRKKMRQLRTLK
jgi:tetratricopeptide (TPR) repeat protein